MGTLLLGDYSKPNRRSWRRYEEIVNHLTDFFKGRKLQEIGPLGIEKSKRKRVE